MAERLGRRSKLDLGLCGDVRETIRALLPLVKPVARTLTDVPIGPLDGDSEDSEGSTVRGVAEETEDPPSDNTSGCAPGGEVAGKVKVATTEPFVATFWPL